MAENNNLVLTVVLVAAALLLFNGGLGGQTGYDVFSQSCGKEGSTYCKDNWVMLCENHILRPIHQCGVAEDGSTVIGERCDTKLIGGQTNNPQISSCEQQVSDSLLRQSFSGPRLA